MKKNFTEIEIPFGVKDSELYQFTYTIPDGYSAEIKDGKVIVKKKESEDERIRNEIIDYLNFAESHNLLRAAEYDKKKGWLAYLEKQKVQKLAEWSEEDKTMLERCISKMANIIPVPGKHGLEDMSFEKHTDEELVIWLNSLPKRFELQPKHEWSEEDKKILYEIIRNVSAYDAYTGTTYQQPERHDKKINFLRTLRPSWKPSAQEKWALRTAIHVFIKERNLPKAAAQLQNILDTFEGKESRKDWKPSEEQMKALENVIKCELSAGLHTRAKILQTLQNDLKKL